MRSKARSAPTPGHRLLLHLCAVLLCLSSAPAAFASSLPAPVLQALQRAKVPPQALAVVVEDPRGEQVRLRWNAQQPMNPASVVKLLTTTAALETLGPSWTWQTPVWLDGPIDQPGPDGVLQGHLGQAGPGEMVRQQLQLRAQIQQGQQRQQQGQQWQRPRRAAHRRASRGSSVGATPMLDQLPTAIPIVRATANQNRVLPPKKIRPTRGSRVVSEV